MDDFSRFILGWDLKVDMTGSSLEDVLQQAVDFTGMTTGQRSCRITVQATFPSNSMNISDWWA